jgi:type I restriction enzyme, S subunit
MNSWQNLELVKVINFNPSEKLPKGSVAKKIPMANLEVFARKITGFEFEVYNSGPKFRNGDTLVAKITPCLENGKTAQVDILNDNEVAFGSSEFIVLRETEKSTNGFVYYLAKSPAFRRKAISCMEGTSGRKRVNEGALKHQVLPIPNKVIQAKIASVLSSLDSKIELNNRINSELEAMAKTIYDYWFVQFDFPDANGKPYKSSGGKMIYSNELKREIPEGWDVKSLSDITSIINRGISPKYLESGGICVLNQKCIRNKAVNFEFSRRHNADLKNSIKAIEFGDALVNSTGVGTLGRVAMVRRLPELIVTVDSHVTIIRADIQKISKLYLGFTLTEKQAAIESLGDGSTGQTELSRVKLGGLSILVPKDKIQSTFADLLLPIMKKMANNEEENQHLLKIRDWLLPMLMNGQVTVKDIEKEEEMSMAAEPKANYNKNL